MEHSATVISFGPFRLISDKRELWKEEVLFWFTEGFDTQDLREAKALLKELGEREYETAHSEECGGVVFHK